MPIETTRQRIMRRFVYELGIRPWPDRSRHDCPICGYYHRLPLTGAERVRAYRERQRGQ